MEEIEGRVRARGSTVVGADALAVGLGLGVLDLESVVVPGHEAEFDAGRVGDAGNHVPLEDEEAPEERVHLGEQFGDGLVGGPG